MISVPTIIWHVNREALMKGLNSSFCLELVGGGFASMKDHNGMNVNKCKQLVF
jgi:hypothetical protein